jgi:hypothetical protein
LGAPVRTQTAYKGSVATFRFWRKIPRFRDFAEKPVVDFEPLSQGGFRAKPGFSEESNLCNTSVSGDLASWTESLLEWRERAVLTPVALSQWGFAEKKLAAQFIILPATLEGLDQLVDRFDTGLPTNLGRIISPVEEEVPETEHGVRIAEVRQYLGCRE